MPNSSPKNPHNNPLANIDLTALLEAAGYIKRTRTPPKEGQLKYNARDTRTTAQLEAARFSGMRANDMWNRFEIWLLGRLESTLTYAEVFINPDRLNLWYCEVFGLDKIFIDQKAQRDLELLRERKALLSEPEVQKAVDALQEKKHSDR